MKRIYKILHGLSWLIRLMTGPIIIFSVPFYIAGMIELIGNSMETRATPVLDTIIISIVIWGTVIVALYWGIRTTRKTYKEIEARNTKDTAQNRQIEQ